jgi:predicted DCC family thiol-disulfide oxidoreductase YuxK
MVQDILLMDGDCGLCSKLANFLHPRLSQKNSIKFLSNSSEEGKLIISKLPKSQQVVDTVYLVRNGKYYIKSAAAIRCLIYMKWHYKSIKGFLEKHLLNLRKRIGLRLWMTLLQFKY